MIRSMTAFARSEKTEDPFSILIEIRSYNHRYLDIALRIPNGYLPLEDRIKGLIRENICRGRIEVSIHIKENIQDIHSYEIDEIKAASYYRTLVRLKEMLSLDGPVSLDLLAREEGVIQPGRIDKDLAEGWMAVRACLCDSLSELTEMRKKEGKAIEKDFMKRLVLIERQIDRIEKASLDRLPGYQTRLKDRLSELTKNMIEIEPERIAQEAAFIAERSDITEEIVRARSHLEQFRVIMASEEPAGRKLNFLLQEFNREFNTMGSKTESAEVAHMVVEAKSELEKIREQVLNVE